MAGVGLQKLFAGLLDHLAIFNQVHFELLPSILRIITIYVG